MTESVDRAALRQAIGDLLTVRPGPGIRRIAMSSLSCLSMLALTFYFVDEPTIFLSLCILNGFVYTAVMTLTHDAIHHTLTGIAWLDEGAPRAFSYCIFWPHGIYSELHKLHHRMNGRDLRDPERPTWTASEVERAGWLGRLLHRWQWPLNLFVFGGIGMVVKHLHAAWKLRKVHPPLMRAARIDAIGISFCLILTLWLILSLDVFWEYVIYFVAMERVIGFFHQLRSMIEHYGLWDEGRHHLDGKMLSCRNIATNRFMRLFFNGLNFHSVHHAYPAIPFYNLETAHRRIAELYAIAGRPLTEEPSYLRTALRLARTPALIKA